MSKQTDAGLCGQAPPRFILLVLQSTINHGRGGGGGGAWSGLEAFTGSMRMCLDKGRRPNETSLKTIKSHSIHHQFQSCKQTRAVGVCMYLGQPMHANRDAKTATPFYWAMNIMLNCNGFFASRGDMCML